MMIMLGGTMMTDLVPPWPPEAPQDLAQQHEQQSSSSSPSFTAFHVTMIFVAIVLCVIICAIPWDNMKCCSGSRERQQQQQQQSASEVTDEEEAREGLSKKVIRSFKIVRYGSSSTKWGAKEELGSATECMICLSDFRNGQRIRLLPECNHGFHKRCIDQWLLSHSSCPICRNALLVLSPDKSVQHHHHRLHQQQLQQIHDVVPVAVTVASDHVESEDAANNVYRTYVVISD